MLLEDVEVHRLTYEDVMRMAEVGILGEDDRVELIDGVLVDMIRPTPEHSATVERLTRAFVRAIDGLGVRVQDTLRIDDGFVQPDIFVFDAVPDTEHPRTAHLVVEVAATSQRHDRRKAGLYARVGVNEVWLVDLVAREVAVHRQPSSDGYASVTVARDGVRITPLLGRPELDVTELLGPQGEAQRT